LAPPFAKPDRWAATPRFRAAITERSPIQEPPLSVAVRLLSYALLVGFALARGDFVEGVPFRFYPREHGARDVPSDAHDTSSPTPDSESSVTSVWRLSCHRPFTLAFWHTVLLGVLSDVIGRTGSLGSGVPKANTNHSGRHSPKRRAYQAAHATGMATAVSFSGITRPVSASVFDLPTVSVFLVNQVDLLLPDGPLVERRSVGAVMSGTIDITKHSPTKSKSSPGG